MFVRTLLLATVLVAAPLTATKAQVPTQAVGYSDLNLASPSGQAALEARIASAARAVCAPEDYRDLQQLSTAAACEKSALAKADAAVRTAVAAAQSASPVAAR